jgi:hypothetical protein
MSTLPVLRLVAAIAQVVVVSAGCAGAASGTPPGSTAEPQSVRTSAQAVARVVATEPRLTGMEPFDTGLIGQSSWYTVEPASGVGAFVVTVEVGWGDCPAGCINEHSWVFAVAPDGGVSIVSESGPAVPADAWPSPLGAGGTTGIGGTAVAGPGCPVETVPPDPDCAPRPVVGAEIIVRDAAGSEVARATTGPDGSFFVEVAAGNYTVEPQQVEGLMGTAAALEVTVVDGLPAHVQLDYDTGIR